MITDEDVIRILKDRHNLCVGERTAEEVRNKAISRSSGTISVIGRSFTDGERVTIDVSVSDPRQA